MSSITSRILVALKEHDGYVSGQDLSRTLGVSRAAVSNHIGKLREQGYEIESVPRRGHMLKAGPDALLASEVQPLLTTERIGRTFMFLPSVDSSNSYAARLPVLDAPDGTVVVADTQTGGRGRMGRDWFSPAGCNLYFSILLRPDVSPAELPQLALVTGAAIHAVLTSRYPGLGAGVKWPNDILVDGRKVAGVLCEMEAEADRVHHVVLGVGLNANVSGGDFPRELRGIATSLQACLGRRVDRVELLAAILNQLEVDYGVWLKEGLEPLLPRLEAASVLSGLAITVETGRGELKGTVVKCLSDGCLQIRLKDGTLRSIPSGEVHVNWRAVRAAPTKKNRKKT